MITLENISFSYPNRDALLENVNLTLGNHEKIALVGDNGSGKSTLLKIISGSLPPSKGIVRADSKPYYIPQIFGQFNDLTVAEALRIDKKLAALKEILEGNLNEINIAALDEDWTIEEKSQEALSHWELDNLDLNRKMSNLSGGQKTLVFLAGIMIHLPEIVLLDEPSNHLDAQSRKMLYEYVEKTSNTLIVVSHDRALLGLLNTVCEIEKRGVTVYGGNYEFYRQQKAITLNALNNELKSREKARRKAKEIEKEVIEKRQRLESRGQKNKEKGGLPTILMNARKNSAENSTSRLKNAHTEKVAAASQKLRELQKQLPVANRIKLDFDNSTLHNGKILVRAENINFGYESRMLWQEPLNFLITSGERLVITGRNGSGKTTLIKMILGNIEPLVGHIKRDPVRSVYIDQDYSLIDGDLTVYGQAQKFNQTNLEEHEIKIRLNRFLFSRYEFDKSCSALSGGEKMRLMLCCLMIGNKAPDIFILDEPTNNLDIQSAEILTKAINEYQGTLLVVSHDAYFLEQINIQGEIRIKQ